MSPIYECAKNRRSRRRSIRPFSVVLEQAESAVAVGGDVFQVVTRHAVTIRSCVIVFRYNTTYETIFQHILRVRDIKDRRMFSFGNLCKFRVLTSNAQEILSSVWIEVGVIAAVVWDPLWLIL